MSRAAKKGLTRSQMRAVITRWGKARAALREMYLGPQPDNYRDIVNEHDTSDVAVGAMLNRVMAERAELVKALGDAVELHMGLLHSDYTGRHIDAAEHGEVGALRAVIAKYEVKP